MGDESMRSNTSMMSKMADIEGIGYLVFSNTVSNPIWLHRFWLHLVKKNEIG